MKKDLLSYSSFYFVGIKGVAMASLAQCLVDAGKKVQGSDVAEEFVTQKVLVARNIPLYVGFESPIPDDVDCVVYTAAHKAQQNPQVVYAQQKGLPLFPQAEAIADLFNRKKGIAVCGVGGKSTTSAMISWILEKTGMQPSFSVGVGNIAGLEKTGQWNEKSEFFVAEADEYVIDPSAPSRGEEITPRFSFMKPFLTVCTNIRFDHPDVYKDFDHTKQVYKKFFDGMKEGGKIIASEEDRGIFEEMFGYETKDKVLFFSEMPTADIYLKKYDIHEGITISQLVHKGKEFRLELYIPGKYNVKNALGALLATYAIGVPIEKGVQALTSFRSTMRRGELIGKKHGVLYYDDYAHHPNEVKNVIHAFCEWFPNQKLVVGFQSHTFSRTKALFNDFVNAFEEADKVVMIDIFASAREAFDPTMTSDLLCEEINKKFPKVAAENVKTIENLVAFCQNSLQPGDVFLTVGAGDIYKVHYFVK